MNLLWAADQRCVEADGWVPLPAVKGSLLWVVTLVGFDGGENPGVAVGGQRMERERREGAGRWEGEVVWKHTGVQVRVPVGDELVLKAPGDTGHGQMRAGLGGRLSWRLLGAPVTARFVLTVASD